MKKVVLFVILDRYSDWEYAFLATALHDRIRDRKSLYTIKTLSTTKAPIKSIGGFTTLPDYDINSFPADYAAVFLIGGYSWCTKEAEKIAPVIKQADADGKIIGAICDATVFLGIHGLLNNRNHTSNGIEDLINTAKDNYSGQKYYQNEQAVRDKNLITANGTGHMEFAKESLLALNAYPADYIEEHYNLFKLGYIEMLQRGLPIHLNADPL